MRQLAPAAAALALASAPVPAAGGFGAGIEAGWFDMTLARDSASAVFGSSGGAIFGGEVRHALTDSLFVAAGARYFARTGERVFVAAPGAEVFRLGHPLRLRIVPVRASLAHRVGEFAGFTAYAGGGAGIVFYREESEVAGETSTLSRTRASGHLLAGVERGRGSLRFALELAVMRVPGTIGREGVSAVYGESDVGGVSLVVKVFLQGGRDRGPTPSRQAPSPRGPSGPRASAPGP
jgi:hypothetical protein